MSKSVPQSDESNDLAEERRQQILDASLRCFRKQGFHQTTLRDIAHEFGMSVGHIYNYFKNKEAIIEAMVENHANKFISTLHQEELNQDATDKTDRYSRLNSIVDAFMDQELAPLAVAIMNEAMINPRIYELTIETTRQLREHIIQTYYGNLSDASKYAVPAPLVEARVVAFRSMLEGLRYSLLFNPTVDRELLKKVTVERILTIVEMERRQDELTHKNR